MNDSSDSLAISFGQAAASYERGRPEYPAKAVGWMLDGVALDGVVLDVGAGTGKLTRAVAATGREVIAIDPDPKMLETLSESVSDVPVRVGTAEAIPVDDQSVDAVVGGQMWHWVDPVLASAEVGRVLRPGGVLGLIWNTRDESVPWVAGMSEIMSSSAAERMISEDGVRVHAPFGDVERAEFRWSRPMTREDLMDMVRSRSYVITATSEVRAGIERDLAELFDSLSELADAGTIDLPYTTHVYRSVRLPGHQREGEGQ